MKLTTTATLGLNTKTLETAWSKGVPHTDNIRRWLDHYRISFTFIGDSEPCFLIPHLHLLLLMDSSRSLYKAVCSISGTQCHIDSYNVLASLLEASAAKSAAKQAKLNLKSTLLTEFP